MKHRSQDELDSIKKAWCMSDGVLLWARKAGSGKKAGDPVDLRYVTRRLL